MAEVTRDEIIKLAKLSRIKLSDEQIDRYQKEIGTILEFVKKLEAVDTGGLEPTSQVTGLKNVMREDKTLDYGVSKEDLLKNAPEQKDGYFKVKRVL